jgi:hypothetical protein
MPIIPATQELEEDQSLFKASHAKKKRNSKILSEKTN